MNKNNILFLIVENLSAEDLLIMGQVNRLSFNITNTPSLWKREVLRQYCGSLEYFGSSNSSSSEKGLFSVDRNTEWKKQYLQCMSAQKNWESLSDQIFTDQELGILSSEFFEILKEPTLPVPKLRREDCCFATVIQDIMGNGVEPDPFAMDIEYTSGILELLNGSAQNLYDEVKSKQEVNQLTLAKMMSKKSKNNSSSASTACSSLESSYGHGELVIDQSFLDSLELTFSLRPPKYGQTYMLRFLNMLKQSVASHCRITRAYIEASEGNILDCYSQRWSGFSAAVEKLATLYLPFSDLFNEIYEAVCPEDDKTPSFNLARMMVVIWRRKVYEPLANKLNEEILDRFRTLRVNGNNLHEFDYEDIIADVIRGVESLVDLSINEDNVHGLSTDSWEAVGPYADIFYQLKEATRQYYTELANTQTYAAVQAAVTADTRLLARSLPLASQVELQTLSDQAYLSYLLIHFKSKYMAYDGQKQPSHLTSSQVDQMVDTRFGLFLFHLNPSSIAKANIHNFIHSLIYENQEYIQIINNFNLASASASYEDSIDIDCKYNYVPQDTHVLYALHRDLSPTEIQVNL